MGWSERSYFVRCLLIGIVVAVIVLFSLSLYVSNVEPGQGFFMNLFFFSAMFAIPIIIVSAIIGYIIDRNVAKTVKSVQNTPIPKKYALIGFLIPWVLFLGFFIWGESQGAFFELGGIALIIAFFVAIILSFVFLIIGLIIGKIKSKNQ